MSHSKRKKKQIHSPFLSRIAQQSKPPASSSQSNPLAQPRARSPIEFRNETQSPPLPSSDDPHYDEDPWSEEEDSNVASDYSLNSETDTFDTTLDETTTDPIESEDEPDEFSEEDDGEHTLSSSSASSSSSSDVDSPSIAQLPPILRNSSQIKQNQTQTQTPNNTIQPDTQTTTKSTRRKTPFSSTSTSFEAPLPPIDARYPEDDFPRWQYLVDESLHPNLNPAMTDDDQPEDATQFVLVPFAFERMMVFGQLVFIDSVLFTLCVLPLRFLLALAAFLQHRWRHGFYALHHIHKIDVLRVALMVSGFLFVRQFPISILASFIQRESLLKLKIFLTLVELMDRLMSSYGENILGSLFWSVEAPKDQVSRGFFWHFALSVVYICLHSLFLLLNLSVFEVAVNSKNSTLVTLLILVQFAEMKGGVMKKITKSGLQKMVCGDLVERAQLLVILLILCLYNQMPEHPGNEQFWFAIAFIYCSELAVDWLKHSSVINFTRLSPAIYTECLQFFCTLLARFPPQSSLTHISSCLEPELGLLPMPLAIIIWKVVYEFDPSRFFLHGMLLAACGWLVRYLLDLFLLAYSKSQPSNVIVKIPSEKETTNPTFSSTSSSTSSSSSSSSSTTTKTTTTLSFEKKNLKSNSDQRFGPSILKFKNQ